MNPQTRNVTKVWRSCDESVKAEGFAWYGAARILATELDPDNPERGAAVIAVLSPMLSWPQNMLAARRAYAMFHAGASQDEIATGLRLLRKNAAKAAAILFGAEPDAIVSGDKVRSFWTCIARPEAADAVCIDRHAFDIAVGKVTCDDVRGKYLGRKTGYATVAETYRRAAQILSAEEGRTILPSDVQAATWVWWRVNRAAANHG